MDGSTPFATRGARASAGAFAESGDALTSAPRARRESASTVARAGERDARGVHTGRAHGWWSL